LADEQKKLPIFTTFVMVIGVAALQLPEKQNQESINRTFGN
jgi:hypothetical protein